MRTNQVVGTLKRMMLGLAMATATVFQANGCTMGVDNLDSVAGLLETVLEGSDIAISISNSGAGAGAWTASAFDDHGYGWDYDYCDCSFGY